MSTPELLAAMKAEIQTLEQFDRIGNAGRVAMKYGIDHADAHLYRKDLEREAEELAKRNNNEARARVAKMKAEITTVAEFKAIGRDKDVAVKYDVAESSAGRLLTELRQAEGITGNSGWLKNQAGNQDQPSVIRKPESVTKPKSTVLKTPENVHQVDNGVLPLKELEELFKEKPEPDLSKLNVSPVVDKNDPMILAAEMVGAITKKVEARLKDNTVEMMRGFFAGVRAGINEVNWERSKADQLLLEIQMEFLNEVECGVITALNGRELV